MKKIVFAGLMFFGMSLANAAEIRPQFRLWKSTFLTGSMGDVMLTSAPMIFHGINIGSSTINNGNGSYFVFWNDTGDVLTSNVSTKAFISLDNSALNQVTPLIYDIFASSHAFYSKQGGAKITLLWDWMVKPSYITPAQDAAYGQ